MKKKVLSRVLVLGLFMCLSTIGYSQILAWQFALPEPSKGIDRTAKATTNDDNLEQSVLTRGPNAIPKQGNSRGFSGNFPIDANKEEAKKSGAYYQFTVKAKAGYKVSLASLDAVLRRQEVSAHVYRWMYSLDGENFKEVGTEDVIINDLNNNGIKQSQISLAEYKDLQNVPASKTITFRIYAWGGVGESGNQRAFGFGKSNSKGSNVLAIKGTVSK
ncbi:hypothetical protein [Pedobacter arcticus]|uniref:hypothetical protein n=1 Tax=Pedobacter arcticus TaxID=752140 RepID=UPI0012B5EFC5|nr:hypothetical protein [Pedobacter arcticus]